MPTDDEILRLFVNAASESAAPTTGASAGHGEHGIPRAARRRLLDAALGVTAASRTFIAVLEEVLAEQRARLDDLDGAQSRGPAPSGGVDIPVVFGARDAESAD